MFVEIVILKHLVALVIFSNDRGGLEIDAFEILEQKYLGGSYPPGFKDNGIPLCKQ